MTYKKFLVFTSLAISNSSVLLIRHNHSPFAGEGGFATVRKARHRITQNTYAIKTIDLYKIKADQLDSLRNEITIMKMLDHPNVIKLYETFEEESKLHLVLELCEGGDLFDFITKTSIEDGQLIWHVPSRLCEFQNLSHFTSI